MKSQIFNHRFTFSNIKFLLAFSLFQLLSLSPLSAQDTHSLLDDIARLRRVEAMYPDSIHPKYQAALQSLNFCVMNPHDAHTERLLAEAGQTIAQLEKAKGADLSDVCTLRGFLYMVRIVQDPTRNGPKYYLDVLQNYEKALKINPDNPLAQQLQQQFLEGMKQATGEN